MSLLKFAKINKELVDVLFADSTAVVFDVDLEANELFLAEVAEGCLA